LVPANKTKNENLTVFFNGYFTGLLLQLAVGPVFFFILNIVFQRTIIDGLLASAGVTIADYIYILLAVMGVGKLLQNKKAKNIFGIAGAVILFLFGLFMIISIEKSEGAKLPALLPANYFASFSSAFFLTISSPMTIVFWTGLFSAKSIEMGYTEKQLRIFGIAAGLATITFLGIFVIGLSFIKAYIPTVIVKILNLLVGFLLIIYGAIRFTKIIRK
jgi:threonine/homoserine/homoserine lactone efflux protein